MDSLLTKSISVHCFKCCSRVSSCPVKSKVELRIPLRHRKAGITLVPSGVSKVVDGSLNVQPEVPVLNLTSAISKELSVERLILVRECALLALRGSTEASFVRGRQLSPTDSSGTLPASVYPICT